MQFPRESIDAPVVGRIQAQVHGVDNGIFREIAEIEPEQADLRSGGPYPEIAMIIVVGIGSPLVEIRVLNPEVVAVGFDEERDGEDFETAEIRLQGKEPLENVPRSVEQIGHTVLGLEPEAEGGAADGVHLLRIRKEEK